MLEIRWPIHLSPLAQTRASPLARQRQRRRGAGAKAFWPSVGRQRRCLWAGSKRTAAINDRDPARFGLDDEAFEHTVAGECYDVTRIERKHPFIALEARTGAKPHVEREGHLRDVTAFSPR